MVSWVLGILTSRLAGPIAAAVALLLAATLGVQTVKLHHARGDLEAAGKHLEAAERDLGTCRGNVAGLEASLARQNEAVTALKTESDALIARSVKEVSAARSAAETLRQASRRVLSAKAGPDRCASANELILQEAGR
jgi:2,3-bisphosphoglycerate-independent phosphoglycerate mutase